MGDRELAWIGDSLDRISEMPTDVKRVFGHALRLAQRNIVPDIAEPLSAQFEPGVYALRENADKATYRVVYYVKLASGVYVLHAFKKKSKSGIGMPQEDDNKIRARLKKAKELDKNARGKNPGGTGDDR